MRNELLNTIPKTGASRSNRETNPRDHEPRTKSMWNLTRDLWRFWHDTREARKGNIGLQCSFQNGNIESYEEKEVQAAYINENTPSNPKSGRPIPLMDTGRHREEGCSPSQGNAGFQLGNIP
jgi:hypothetical protein